MICDILLLFFELLPLAESLGDGLADRFVALHAEVLEVLVPDLFLDDALQGFVAGKAAAGHGCRCRRRQVRLQE